METKIKVLNRQQSKVCDDLPRLIIFQHDHFCHLPAYFPLDRAWFASESSTSGSLEGLFQGSTEIWVQGKKGNWNALKSFLWTLWTAYRLKPYSPKCDLLWNTLWILLHFRRCSPCSPLHEHGRWSGVPTVAKNAALHSELVPRMRDGSMSAQHSPCPSSLSLHSASPELQHLIWKVFNLSLSKESKYLTCWHWMTLRES